MPALLDPQSTLDEQITASYILPNAFTATAEQWEARGAANVLFVVSTATVETTAQYFGFRNYREQVERQRMLERTTANLAAAHDQLKTLDAFKSQVFANITHELKTLHHRSDPIFEPTACGGRLTAVRCV